LTILFLRPLFFFYAYTASVLIGVASATLIFCSPLFSTRKAGSVLFFAPFPFFTLAQQASCVFGGGFGVFSVFDFCAFFRHAERDDFVFAPPFLFSTLAGQACFVFCGGFGVIFCVHFLRPFCVLFLRFLGLGWW
jgi:hypothetical protein